MRLAPHAPAYSAAALLQSGAASASHTAGSEARSAQPAGASPTGRGVASLAADMNVSTSALQRHLAQGGLLSFTAGSSGAVSLSSSSGALAGLPLDEWGTPDFDAIKAAGGTVTGTMPPNGGSKIIELCDGKRTVLYSAQIELPGGRTQYVKGMAHQSDGSGTVSSNLKNLSDALGLLKGLPNSMAEARNRIGEYNNGLRSTIDFAM
jgi:hypothetical protein